VRRGALACLFVLLNWPALTQQIGVFPRASDRMWATRDIRPGPRCEAPIFGTSRLGAVHQDCEDRGPFATKHVLAVGIRATLKRRATQRLSPSLEEGRKGGKAAEEIQ
jgi:hypothetical protein